MIWSEYGTKNYVLYMLCSLSGSALLIKICSHLDGLLRWSSIIGRLSMLLLILHMYIHQILRTFINNAVCNYVLTIVLTIAIAFIIDKYLPIVTGKRPILKMERE